VSKQGQSAQPTTEDDGWDWPFMLFFGTVELRMTEEQFWNTTPRKFRALSDAAIEYKQLLYDSSDKKAEPEIGYIDQIPGW